MNDKSFLEHLKHSYENLSLFSMRDNVLIFNGSKKYVLPLSNVQLSTLPENFYQLAPDEIFQIIYINELLYHANLTELQINNLKSFTKQCLKLKEMSVNDDEVDENKLWCYEVTINEVYKPQFEALPSSKVIIDTINEYENELHGGKGKEYSRVLVPTNNPNFDLTEEPHSVLDYSKAGFTTIVLIAIAAISTLSYIAFFVINH